MERFSPQELAKKGKTETEKKKKTGTRKNQKYITKMVNGEKHMILNPDYIFKHND
jgi:hypothetical protein